MSDKNRRNRNRNNYTQLMSHLAQLQADAQKAATLDAIKPGMTVRLHPASDFFVMGATQATCTSRTKSGMKFQLNAGPAKKRVSLSAADILSH